MRVSTCQCLRSSFYPDSSPSVAVFCRNHEFNFTGRCIVSLSTAEDARRLIEYGHRRVLGGNTLKVNYVSLWRDEERAEDTRA